MATVVTRSSIQCFIISILCLYVVSNIHPAHADVPPDVYKQCAACHGEKAQGNNVLKAPSLAGLSAHYLIRQLEHFKSGIRGTHKKDALGQQMRNFAKLLDDKKDIPLLANYLSALPAPNFNHDLTGDMKNGSRYYQAKCGACHGGNAQGNSAFKAPRLSGQSLNYLRRQMINFTTGLRGSHQKDKYGRQMAMMAKTSSGKELDDILFFISKQK